MSDTFTWIPFYEELANKLLEYKDKRKELVALIKEVYSDIDIKLPTLEKENNITDIDPFTVYGLFNKGITEQNRITIITSFAGKLNLKSTVPTDFNGIPVLNNMSATFYYFEEEREKNDIQNLWYFFEYALLFSKTNNNPDNFIKYFNIVSNQKGIKWNLTMGLFWMRPYTYLNLDSQNREFISNPASNLHEVLKVYPKLTKDELPNGSQYLDICIACKNIISNNSFAFRNLPEMSAFAWSNNSEKNKISQANVLKWFAPLINALKNLDNSAKPKQVYKEIAENEQIPKEILEKKMKNGTPKFENEIAWARNYLVYADIIDKKTRGVWTLTEKGKKIQMTEEVASKIIKENTNAMRSGKANLIVKKRYWIYSPGEQARLWDDFYSEKIMGIGWDFLGDISIFSSKEEIKSALRNEYISDKSYKNDSLAIWQFTNEVNVGDVVYVKKGMSTLLGRGEVESNYIFDSTRKEYKNIRKINWTHKGEWEHPGQAAQKTLTDVTQYIEYVEKLELLFSEGYVDILENDEVILYDEYSDENFLDEVFINNENYNTLCMLLKRKKNIILQGAPGVGKTFAAKRLAYSIMGEKDSSRVELIQFHQSYSYEDFIMGYRPNTEGFKLEKGVFYQFCKKAQDDNERDYFFIIDEINRGNISKIFGELFMLIEHDKRGENNSIRLVYENEQFFIPSNVHIIGMMNTADRSLAMLDYALRRRFAFFELEPAFDSEGFKMYQGSINSEKFNKLIGAVRKLNDLIKDDESLGTGFRIGHSYFIIEDHDTVDDNLLNSIINYEILPLLQEYWFDETSKIDECQRKLIDAIT